MKNLKTIIDLNLKLVGKFVLNENEKAYSHTCIAKVSICSRTLNHLYDNKYIISFKQGNFYIFDRIEGNRLYWYFEGEKLHGTVCDQLPETAVKLY